MLSVVSLNLAVVNCIVIALSELFKDNEHALTPGSTAVLRSLGDSLLRSKVPQRFYFSSGLHGFRNRLGGSYSR